MRDSSKWAAAAVGLVAALGAGGVRADSYSLVLQGDVGNLQTESFVASGRQFNLGSLMLDGLSEPLVLVDGDELTATITLLNGPLGVPASPNQVFGFEVTGPDQPQYTDDPLATGGWQASATFYLAGEVVASTAGLCTNCSFVAVFRSPGAAIAFDQVEVNGQFRGLTTPYTIDSARATYFLSQPVPEPATWALWLAGLGLAGAVARRRPAAAAA